VSIPLTTRPRGGIRSAKKSKAPGFLRHAQVVARAVGGQSAPNTAQACQKSHLHAAQGRLAALW
jgi:hypothetical protein